MQAENKDPDARSTFTVTTSKQLLQRIDNEHQRLAQMRGTLIDRFQESLKKIELQLHCIASNVPAIPQSGPHEIWLTPHIPPFKQTTLGSHRSVVR